MKKIIIPLGIILLLTSGTIHVQKISKTNRISEKKDIYVLGTFHFREHNFIKYPQNLKTEIDNAIKFKPEIVCVEWMNKSEELDIYNLDYSRNIREMVLKYGLDTMNTTHIIDSIYLELSNKGNLIRNRSILANYLYITRDYINACYQWYLIESETKDTTKLNTILPGEIKTLRYSLYDDPDNQKREIIEIAFPIAKALNHEKIYSIDFRHDQRLYSSYISSFNKRFKEKHGYDPQQQKTEPIQEMMLQWLETDLLNHESTYYAKLNSKEFGKCLFAYYYDMLYSYGSDSEYQKWHELQLEKRNFKMFELLMTAIAESNAQKTFALVGFTHKYYIERFLKESNLFEIKNYIDSD